MKRRKRLFLRFIFELLNLNFSYFFQKRKKIDNRLGQQVREALTKKVLVYIIFFLFYFDDYFEPYSFVRQHVFAVQKGGKTTEERTRPAA